MLGLVQQHTSRPPLAQVDRLLNWGRAARKILNPESDVATEVPIIKAASATAATGGGDGSASASGGDAALMVAIEHSFAFQIQATMM